MSESEMVLRVARALAYDVRPPSSDVLSSSEHWASLSAKDHMEYEGNARAAIKAIQPTPAMVEAACNSLYSDNYRKAGEKYREPMFRDMTEALHAALSAALSGEERK